MARTLADLLLEVALPRRWPRRAWLGAMFVLTFAAGFAVCQWWQGPQLEAMRQTLAAWHEREEHSYALHHKPIKITKGLAQGIVGKIEKEGK